MARAVRRAKTILHQGGPHALQRAAKALRAGQLAPSSSATFRALEALHPRGRAEGIGPLPANRAPEIGSLEKVLPRVLKRLNNGSAPGISGWNGAHLAAVWAGTSKEGRDGLHLLLRDICNGVFSGECRRRLLACRLIPLEKKGGGVRPIAIAELFAKAAAHCAVALVEDDILSLFPCVQYGVKRPGGSETAAHLTRNLLRDHGVQHRSTTCAIKLDFQNAFNSVSRHKVWETLQRHDCLASMLKPFYAQYAEPTELLVYDGSRLVHKLTSSEGVRQGDPFAALGFALTVQPLCEAALRQGAPGMVDGVSIQDDFTIIGDLEQAMRVFDYVQQHSLRDFGLTLRVDKCAVWLPDETLEAAGEEQQQRMRDACAARQLRIDSTMESLGVLFGRASEVASFCEAAVDDCEFFFRALEHRDLPLQHASLLLRACQLPRLGYVARTAHPDQLAAAAQRFDRRAQHCWMRIHRFTDEDLSALAGDEHGDARCTAEQLLQRIQLPVSCGGMGLRPVARIMHAAYYASSIESLPELLRLRPRLAATDEHGVHAAQSSFIYQELEHLHQHLARLTQPNRRARRAAQREAAQAAIAAPVVAAPAVATASLTDAADVAAAPAAAPAATVPPPVPAPAPAMPTSPSPRTRPSSSAPILQKDFDDIWRQACEEAELRKTAPAKEAFTVAKKLQHNTTEQIERLLAERLQEACAPFQRTILTELDHAAQSGAWLLALPTEPTHRLRDDEYALATRKRLGMLPHTSLRDDSCLACHGRNLHLPQLRADPHHAEACVQQTGASVTQRHNLLVHTLAELARSVGGSVRTDQPALGSALVQVTDATTGETREELQRSQLRGDLLVVHGAKRILVDVTVPRATAPTNLSRSAAGQRPGGCVATAEQHKRDKYEEPCKQRGMTFVPFAVESYGGLGPAARKLLTTLAGLSGERTARAFLLDAMARVSVTLQRGNALVLQRGMQQLRMDQLGRLGGDHPLDPTHLQQTAGRRRQARTLAGWAEQPVDLASAFHSSLRAGGGAAASRSFRAGHLVEVSAG